MGMITKGQKKKKKMVRTCPTLGIYLPIDDWVINGLLSTGGPHDQKVRSTPGN